MDQATRAVGAAVSRYAVWAASALLAWAGAGAPAAAAGLDCGTYAFPYCKGAARQFDPSFRPGAGFGGFGGQKGCKAQRTPVVFVHGNADSAIGWAAQPAQVAGFPKPPDSVYDSFRAAGYQPCELFGVTYLSAKEQGQPEQNLHRPSKYAILKRFIESVKRATGSAQVDIVAHSLGVSTTLAALSYYDAPRSPVRLWGSVRRFVNIAGGLHGLGACQLAGPANPAAPTCKSVDPLDPWSFGFYPDNVFILLGRNEWTAVAGRFSLREAPTHHPDVAFYTLSAGRHDQVHCAALHGLTVCEQGPLFTPAANVRAQLDIGAGATAEQPDFNLQDGSWFTQRGGDADGVGHFGARNQAGQILVQMLTTDCRGLECRGDYAGGPIRVALPSSP